MKINTNYLLIAAGLVGVVIIFKMMKAKSRPQNIVGPNVADLESNTFDATVYDPAGMYKGVFP